MTEHDRNGWISFEDAIRETGRSESTLKRAVRAGKIGKRLVPAPGRRPEAYLSAGDVARLFGEVHVPATALPDLSVDEPNRTNAAVKAVVPVREITREVTVSGLGPALDGLAAWIECGRLDRKLTWTLAEARTMTGLSRPALRELVEAHPDLAIRRGRRMWLKAGKLREVLG